MVLIEELRPYERNAWTHTDAQIDQIVASLREFGWTNRVLIDGQGGIIAGHARVQAAKRLCFAHVPCIELSRLSEAQKRAYVIADNKLALNAGWDEKLLALELSELKDLNFDLDLTGFGLDEIEALFAESEMGGGLTDPAWVARQLGHSSPLVTLRIYAHWVPGSKRVSADVLDGKQNTKTTRKRKRF